MKIGDKVSWYDITYDKPRYGIVKEFTPDGIRVKVSVCGAHTTKFVKISLLEMAAEEEEK